MHVCVCRVGVRWEGWEGWEKISTLHSYQLPHSVMSWKFPCIDLLFKCLTSKFYPDLVFWVIIYVQFLYKAMNSLHCVPTWHLCTWMCVCSMNLTNQNFKIKCYVYHEPHVWKYSSKLNTVQPFSQAPSQFVTKVREDLRNEAKNCGWAVATCAFFEGSFLTCKELYSTWGLLEAMLILDHLYFCLHMHLPSNSWVS